MTRRTRRQFEKLTDSPRTSFDILVEETDPALVTMQLDLGWASGVRPTARTRVK
jgi:hypothetical protein